MILKEVVILLVLSFSVVENQQKSRGSQLRRWYQSIPPMQPTANPRQPNLPGHVRSDPRLLKNQALVSRRSGVGSFENSTVTRELPNRRVIPHRSIQPQNRPRQTPRHQLVNQRNPRAGPGQSQRLNRPSPLRATRLTQRQNSSDSRKLSSAQQVGSRQPSPLRAGFRQPQNQPAHVESRASSPGNRYRAHNASNGPIAKRPTGALKIPGPHGPSLGPLNRSQGQGNRPGSSKAKGSKAKKADKQKLNVVKNSMSRAAQRERAQQSQLSPAPPAKPRDPKAKKQVTELTINNPEDYYQGDVDLSDEQAEAIIEQLENSGRKKRKVGVSYYKHWNSFPISYSFASTYPLAARQKIREAIRVWEENTCIRFQENGPNIDRIEFVNGGGCSSMIGMVGGVQEVSIAVPGCDTVGIVCHEIGHALGFFHEQTRPDRDQFVYINYNNINSARWNNFIKASQNEISYYNQPYDYGSVMHYSGSGFANNYNIPTIQTRDTDFQNTIGQRRGPSFVDVSQVNAAYCASTCALLSCEHGGYADPNNCARCKCPDGWGGTRCGEVAHLRNCGGQYQAYRQETFVASPNYPYRYPRDYECSFLFKTDPGAKVFVEFVETFEFECKESCDISYIEIKTGPEWRRTGPRFCCTRPTKRFESYGNKILVLMKGYGGYEYRGFKAKFWTNAARDKPVGAVITPKPQTTPASVTDKPNPIQGGGETVSGGPGCTCGQWGIWSQCSQQCGGCGNKERRRRCSKTECYDKEKRRCNFNACVGQMWLSNFGEFHLLLNDCCIGLLKGSDGQCAGLKNRLGELISSVLPSLASGTGK